MGRHCPSCNCTAVSARGNAEDDPRWRLAWAQMVSEYPGLRRDAVHRIRRCGISCQDEIELLYELDMPEVEAPSFRPNAWRAQIRPGEQQGPLPPMAWDPDRFAGSGGWWIRVVYYQMYLSLGAAASPREAVKALAAARRQWHREETARYAAWLCDWIVDRPRIGAQRYLRGLKEIVHAQGGPCSYCGDPNPRSVDHVMPTSRGGRDHLSNLVLACSQCNSLKHNRTPEEWRKAWLARGWSWPPVHEPVEEMVS